MMSSSQKGMPAQLRYLDSVLAWLAEENGRPGGFAYAVLDLNSIGAVGHSRGAKLAALHLVGTLAAGPQCTSLPPASGPLIT